MNIELRKKLDKIVSPENEKNWYVPELFVKNTAPILPKELEIVEIPPEYDKNCNCFIYMFGLHENDKFLKETSGFIYSKFIEHLIDVGELKKISQTKPGAIVLYQNEQMYGATFTHGGIVLDDEKIISKWSWGPLVIHSLFDVPFEYGELVTYYEAISKDEAMNLYMEYKSFNQLQS